MNKHYFWYAGSGRIELVFRTLDDAASCAHQGECLWDVQALMAEPYMAAQLEKIDPENLRAELGEYGAWNEDQLANHEDNLERLVWLAANDVAESPETYRED